MASLNPKQKGRNNSSQNHDWLISNFRIIFSFSVSCSLRAPWIRLGRCVVSLMEDLTPTLSISKGPLQGLDPSKEAPTQDRATDLRGLRGTPWECRTAQLVPLAACCTDSRSVFSDFNNENFLNIYHLHNYSAIRQVGDFMGYILDKWSVKTNVSRNIQVQHLKWVWFGFTVKKWLKIKSN